MWYECEGDCFAVRLGNFSGDFVAPMRVVQVVNVTMLSPHEISLCVYLCSVYLHRYGGGIYA